MIRVILVDDKPLALDVLRNYLQKIPFAVCQGCFTNPLEAMEHIDQHDTDLVLLDIQMPEITGIQLMKMAGSRVRCILITAYPDYAVEGFDLNAIDYLLKPVSFERFYQAMQKARLTLEQQMPVLPVTALPARDFLFFKTERRIRRIDLRDILFIEGRQNYIEVHTQKEKLLALQTLRQTEEQLPPAEFCRVHKSFILRLAAIDAIEQHQARAGAHTIPIGETYREVFYKLVNGI